MRFKEKNTFDLFLAHAPLCVCPCPPSTFNSWPKSIRSAHDNVSSESHWLHLFDFSPVCVFKVSLWLYLQLHSCSKSIRSVEDCISSVTPLIVRFCSVISANCHCSARRGEARQGGERGESGWQLFHIYIFMWLAILVGEE